MTGAGHLIATVNAGTGGVTAEASLVVLAGLGVHHVVIELAPGFLMPGDLDVTGRAHFKRFLQGQYLRLVALGVPAEAASMRDTVELAAALGVAGVIAPVAGLSDDALAAAARKGVELWRDTRGGAGAELLIDRAGDGVVYDVATGLARGDDPAEVCRQLGPRLRLVRMPSRRNKSALAADGGQAATLAATLAASGYGDWPLVELEAADGELATGVERAVARLAAAGFDDAWGRALAQRLTERLGRREKGSLP